MRTGDEPQSARLFSSDRGEVDRLRWSSLRKSIVEDSESRLGLHVPWRRGEVGRHHYKDAINTAQRRSQRFRIVVVGLGQLDALFLPLCGLLRVPHDATNLF